MIVARFECGGKYLFIAAMSVCSHDRTDRLISGKDLTPRVLCTANIVGYAFAINSRDRGVSGQFQACHAEKQSIAYFISRHVFLETESRASQFEGLAGVLEAGHTVLHGRSINGYVDARS